MRKKKETIVEQFVVQPDEQVQSAKKRGRKPKAVRETTSPSEKKEEKKVDGRIKESRLQKVCDEYEAAAQRLVAINRQITDATHKLTMKLECVKVLDELLSSFNALTRKGNVQFELPELGTPYWYIRPMTNKKSFEIVTCQWNNWQSDYFRYCRGNMYLDQNLCMKACHAMNEMLYGVMV